MHFCGDKLVSAQLNMGQDNGGCDMDNSDCESTNSTVSKSNCCVNSVVSIEHDYKNTCFPLSMGAGILL